MLHSIGKGWLIESLTFVAFLIPFTVMASRLKNPWKKFLADATSSDHQQQQQQQEQQQQQQQQEQQQQQQQQSSIPDSSSSSSSSATSSGANVPANSPLTGSDSFGLKTTKEKLKIIGLPSNFRKLRMKFLRHKKEATGSKEENTQFEKVYDYIFCLIAFLPSCFIIISCYNNVPLLLYYHVDYLFIYQGTIIILFACLFAKVYYHI